MKFAAQFVIHHHHHHQPDRMNTFHPHHQQHRQQPLAWIGIRFAYNPTNVATVSSKEAILSPQIDR